jgi:hypothetical protein
MARRSLLQLSMKKLSPAAIIAANLREVDQPLSGPANGEVKYSAAMVLFGPDPDDRRRQLNAGQSWRAKTSLNNVVMSRLFALIFIAFISFYPTDVWAKRKKDWDKMTDADIDAIDQGDNTKSQLLNLRRSPLYGFLMSLLPQFTELNGADEPRPPLFTDKQGNLHNSKGPVGPEFVISIWLQPNCSSALRLNRFDDAAALGHKWVAFLRTNGAFQYYVHSAEHLALIAETRAEDAAAALPYLHDQVGYSVFISIAFFVTGNNSYGPCCVIRNQQTRFPAHSTNS